MPGIASATGLLSARIQPIRRPKPKSVELSGCTRAAPFALRPFAGLFNPYPYGCSVLCNHPADCEAKEVVRRAKDTWKGKDKCDIVKEIWKALLLPEEMEMIRTSLLAMGAGGGGGETAAGNVGGGGDGYNTEVTAPAVPEELFRKYTETDSRPLTPAPTLASGPTTLTDRAAQEDLPATCNPRERTTLVLDLRTSSQNQQENETFSWHALTLELPPTPRKSEIFICKPTSRPQHSLAIPVPPPSSLSSPIAEKCETRGSYTCTFFSFETARHLKNNITIGYIRRIALEEALRVKGDAYTLRRSRQTSASPSAENVLRIFSRQAARFELLDSQSLCGLTSLQYLSKHAYVTSGRKLIFRRIFNKFIEEALHSARRISPSDIEEALREVIGKALTDEQRSYIKSVIGDITQPLGFREWCGLCAAVERLLCPLPSRESDPPTWLERTDFEALERRLKSAGSIDFTLALLLKEIRDR
ncbi:hypothetical protein ALC56_11376 [Trachymyrmex septentrionalis]|uniref:Uncharacterized protein n=1 Tax=Trachymyrmex septentrionalis TaxID=34720 RepID=A0A195F2F6_9HYME|nr:hypothetical protein ALC56_11376 [Trachymyrmex septentrionalis]